MTHAILAALLSFALAAILGPVFIPILTRLKMGQTERALGVKSHLQKAGTPTMGGIIFLIAIAVTALIFSIRYPLIRPILLLTVCFGAIGFFDDYLKVVKKRSDGLFAWQKFLLEFVVTLIFYFYLTRGLSMDLLLRIPFTSGKLVDIGIFAIPLLFFAVIGTVNGVNFTDGLDGLASSVTIVVSVFFVIASLLIDGGVAPFPAAVAGALMGFLLYNSYPAKIFMGDTGSLALGGFVIATAYLLRMPLYVILIGAIYLIEVISVAMQVGYFKMTHGKRIFKMAPIHHHFELCGWSETRVVTVFTVITTLLCLLCLLRV